MSSLLLPEEAFRCCSLFSTWKSVCRETRLSQCSYCHSLMQGRVMKSFPQHALIGLLLGTRKHAPPAKVRNVTVVSRPWLDGKRSRFPVWPRGRSSRSYNVRHLEILAIYNHASFKSAVALISHRSPPRTGRLISGESLAVRGVVRNLRLAGFRALFCFHQRSLETSRWEKSRSSAVASDKTRLPLGEWLYAAF